jgi:hypothetical protein
LFLASLTAASLVGCGTAASGGSSSGTGVDGMAASDSSLAADGASPDGSGADTAGADGKAGDGGSSSADVAVQDTGVGKEQVAAQVQSAKEFEGKFYDALCTHDEDCGLGLYLTNIAGCRAYLLGQGGVPFVADGIDAVAAGRATFDAAKAAACLATVDATCTIFSGDVLPAACREMFVGLVDNGFGCDRDQDCKASFCKKKIVNDSACLGICTAPAAAGGACDVDAGCEAPQVCMAGQCGKYVPAAKGEDCTFDLCGPGLVCVTDGDANTCIEPGGEGAPCYTGEGACTSGFHCEAADFETQGKCAADLALGAACDLDAWYEGAIDNPCGDANFCVPAAVEATATVCKPLAKLGDACTASEQCTGLDQACYEAEGGGYVCDYLPSDGDACEPLAPEDVEAGWLACLPPYVCGADSTCVLPPVTAGKACIEDQCGAGLWCDTTAAKPVCMAYGKAGDACTTFEDESSSCEAGLVCGIKTETCVAPTCK